MHKGAVVFALWLAAVGVAQAEPAWKEGENYFLVQPPQPTSAAKGKVEVV